MSRVSKDPQPDLAQVAIDRMQKQPMVIVCGLIGKKPLTSTERQEILSRVSLMDALACVAKVQSEFDVAYTTHGKVEPLELRFLSTAGEAWVERIRKRINKGDHLLSPRANLQLIREIVEWSSIDSSTALIDRSTLVYLLASINSEQQSRPEFASDVPTDDEIRQLAKEIGGYALQQTMQAAGAIIPELIASLLFNNPLKLEVLQSNTMDTWFRPWPSRANAADLGAAPSDAFQAATGVDLMELIQLGDIVASLSMSAQQTRFRRAELLDAGASNAAVDFLFDRMALTLHRLRDALAQERAAGAVGHQRYTMTQYPFLLLDDYTVLMLRHQWAADRLCGNLLYFEAWAAIKAESSSKARRFKLAMSDVFEDLVGETLTRIAARSERIGRVVREPEMQDAWTVKKGQQPSACDWALLAGKHCVVVDATNHAVKAEIAQGLATFEEYSKDFEDVFTNQKFDQLVSTVRRLRADGGFDTETIRVDTDFIPLVVVPDAGLPDEPIIQAYVMDRGRPKFAEFQPHVFPPGIIQLSDLQTIEGLGELAHGDIIDLIGGSRYAAATRGEGLQAFLARNRLPRPVSRHIRDNTKALKQRFRSA